MQQLKKKTNRDLTGDLNSTNHNTKSNSILNILM